MFNIKVPAHVEDKHVDRYVEGAKQRIYYNARKAKFKNWIAEVPDAQRLADWLGQNGEFSGNWVYPDGTNADDAEFTAEHYPVDDSIVWASHPTTRGIWAGDFGSILMGMRDNLDKYGWLTEKQADVVRKALARKEQWVAEAEAKKVAYREENMKSQWIGKIKERRDWVLTITKVLSFDGQWNTLYINLMKDQNGNIIVGKGTKRYGDEGDTIKVKATIKAHDERDGVKQTVVNRPKFG